MRKGFCFIMLVWQICGNRGGWEKLLGCLPMRRPSSRPAGGGAGMCLTWLVWPQVSRASLLLPSSQVHAVSRPRVLKRRLSGPPWQGRHRGDGKVASCRPRKRGLLSIVQGKGSEAGVACVPLPRPGALQPLMLSLPGSASSTAVSCCCVLRGTCPKPALSTCFLPL